MNTRSTAARPDMAASIADGAAPLPPLSRRSRIASALASMLLSTVLLGSVVLGLTGTAAPPASGALACAGTAHQG